MSNVTLLSVSAISTFCPRSCFLFIYVYAFVVTLLIIGHLINRFSAGGTAILRVIFIELCRRVKVSKILNSRFWKPTFIKAQLLFRPN